MSKLQCEIDHRRCQSSWVQRDSAKVRSRIPVYSVRHELENHRQDIDLRTAHRYNEHCLKAFLSNEPRFIHCCHPACDYVAEVSRNTSWLECEACKTMTCVSCKALWHGGRTCKQEREEQKKLAKAANKTAYDASEQHIKKNAKHCPKCKLPGEKVSGCDHMTCPHCKHQYCWICFVDYKTVLRGCNNVHLTTCKYWAPKRANPPTQATLD